MLAIVEVEVLICSIAFGRCRDRVIDMYYFIW